MKYVVITVVNREIYTEFYNTIEEARKSMMNTYKIYLESEDLEEIDYNTDGKTSCWISGDDDVDIEIHEVI